MKARGSVRKKYQLACPDWFDRMKKGSVPFTDLDLDVEQASAGVRVFNKLRLPDVTGTPTLQEAGGRWIKEIVAAVFGSVDADQKRWLREFFLLVPKKNSKTTNSAAIMLVALLLNQRPRAEFLLIGPTQLIADTAFSQAVGFIEADETGFLSKRFHVRDHKKEILDRSNKAVLRIKTFDNKVMTGAKPVGVLLDEVHLIGKISYGAKVLEQIRGGYEVNPEGFFIMITTQSDEPPAGAFKSELEYARDIRDGKVDGDMLPILYEFPMAMQRDKARPWLAPDMLKLVHPNLDRSRTLDGLVNSMQKAKAKGPEEMDIWISQHLNIQLGIAEHRNSWAGARYWLDAADPEPITPQSMVQRCDVVTVGVDGGGLDDMLGLCLAGRDRVSRDWLFWAHAWIHPDAIEQRKENASRYMDFVKEGSLTVCDDPSWSTQDVDELADIVQMLSESGCLPEKYAVGLDPVGVASITSELSARGISQDQMVSVPQGYKLSGIIKGMERRLKDGRVWHDGSDLMAWCVGNAKTETRGSALLITKQVSGTAKIDPLIAAFNAFSLMQLEPESQGSAISPWDADPDYRMVF